MTQEALRMALEALEDNQHFIETYERPEYLVMYNDVIDKCKETLAQEQEPVVWVSEDVCEGQYIDGRPRKIWWECEKGVGTAFYTTTPQRTWVGLTDEEIAQGCKESWVTEQAWQSAVWWAEAKLKQKNHVAQETNS